MTEFEKIEAIKKWIRRARGKNSSRVIVDIGDDAAVIRRGGGDLVVTTDSQVEGTHFSLTFARPEEIGHRLLASNLSDLAAMGARAETVVVSLTLGASLGDRFLEGFYTGMGKLARRFDVDIVGGNLAKVRGPSVLDMTAFGTVRGEALRRGGARDGDLLAVTGSLGDSAGGLYALTKWKGAARTRFPRLAKAHLLPMPQSEFGPLLRGLASSAIDISDGLSSELHHLCAASGTAAWIEESRLPISAELGRLADSTERESLEWALHGGESYGLLFTVAPGKWSAVERAACKARTQVTVIGMIERSSARTAVVIHLVSGNTETLPNGGWKHF